MQVLREHLAQRYASAQAHGVTGDATTAAARLHHAGNGLASLVLHELAHVVADHAHADLLVQDFLQLFRQRQVLQRQAFELEPDLGKGRFQLAAQRGSKILLVGGQVQKRHTTGRYRVADVLQHQAAQLAVEVGRGVALARAGNFSVEQLGVDHAVGVVAKGAQAHGAEVLVTDRDGLGRAPFLVQLLARAEEIDIALERGLEQLVPVLQVSQDRNRLRRKPVHAGAELVGDLALVDEQRHLRFAHR